MKKKIVLAMAIIMVLGSVKAMAEEYSRKTSKINIVKLRPRVK
ncbi:hypothetical protein [Bdellovibrio bacteriovorus]